MAWIDDIQTKITARVPELINDSELLQELIDESFYQIVNYTQANSYKKEWDNVLVECVVRAYNYSGLEGSTERSSGGVRDVYESSDVISNFISKRLKQYIRPIGYSYQSTRFDQPKD